MSLLPTWMNGKATVCFLLPSICREEVLLGIPKVNLGIILLSQERGIEGFVYESLEKNIG
jgi:hypothetical protein